MTPRGLRVLTSIADALGGGRVRMIGVCNRCMRTFETTEEDAATPGTLCPPCHRGVGRLKAIGRLQELAAAVDEVLLRSMPAGLKDAVDQALAAGTHPADVLRYCSDRLGENNTVALSVEAYLDARQKNA